MARPKQKMLALFPEVLEATQDLSNEQFGELMRAAFAFRFDGTSYNGEDQAVKVSFRFVSSQIERCEEQCVVNRENAKKRWGKQGYTTDGKSCETMQNENFVDGKLSRDAYAAQKADLIQKREDAYTKESKIKARLAAATERTNPVIQKYCSYADLDTLTDKSAVELLERITIFPDGMLDIKLAYADELAELAESFHLDILKGA